MLFSLLSLVIGSYCARPYFGIWKSRTEILEEFANINTEFEMQSFLNDCKNDDRFVCLKGDEVLNYKCLAGYTNLANSAALLKLFLNTKNNFYSKAGLKYIFILSITRAQNDISDLLFPRFANGNAELVRFENMPGWASDIVGITHGMKLIDFIMLYYNLGVVKSFLQHSNENEIFTLTDGRNLHIREYLVAKYNYCQWPIIRLRGTIYADYPYFAELVNELSLNSNFQCDSLAGKLIIATDFSSSRFVDYFLNNPELIRYSNEPIRNLRIKIRGQFGTFEFATLSNLIQIINFNEIYRRNVDLILGNSWRVAVFTPGTFARAPFDMKEFAIDGADVETLVRLALEMYAYDTIRNLVTFDYSRPLELRMKLSKSLLRYAFNPTRESRVKKLLDLDACLYDLTEKEILLKMFNLNRYNYLSLATSIATFLDVKHDDSIYDDLDNGFTNNLKSILYKSSDCSICFNKMYGMGTLYVLTPDDGPVDIVTHIGSNMDIDIDIGRDVKVLECGHHFHDECISKWIRTMEQQRSNPICPVCKQIIVN